MVTLTKKTLNFNPKIKLSNDGGSLSSDTGEFLFSTMEQWAFILSLPLMVPRVTF